VGFFASGAPDMAGNLRELPYSWLNIPGSTVWGVALTRWHWIRYLFLQAFRVFCAIYHSTKCLVHICFWGTI
jgi:hypothetical protein